MDTKEEPKENNPEEVENENENNPEEEKEEEEPVDLELQKEMKGIKIDDSDFSSKPQNKKGVKKIKNTEDKKSKKKGQDFLDYANKNNIQINLEYEENKYQTKKKDEQKNSDKNVPKFNNNKRQYNKGGYKNEKYKMQKKMQFNYSGNKFDSFGQRPFYQNYQHQPAKLVENQEILEFLEKKFSEENLNKDIYIRKKLKDDKIPVEDIVNYYDIKNNNINKDKILEIIKGSKILENVNEENKDYIRIKDFDKLKLLSLEEIYANKKANRLHKSQPYMPQQMGTYSYPPYLMNMQNNYYMYNNIYPYNYQNVGYYAPQENK